MRTAIIIEDRYQRQVDCLGIMAIGKLSDIDGVDNPIRTDHGLSIFKSIREDKSFHILDSYDLIAVHESFLKEANIRDDFVGYAMENDKELVLFSGSNTQTLFRSQGGTMLSLDPESFYEGLLPFIKKYVSSNEKPHILELVYGDRYKLSFLLQYQRILWQNNEKNEREKVSQILGLITPDIIDELQRGGKIYNTLVQSYAKIGDRPFNSWWIQQESPIDNGQGQESNTCSFCKVCGRKIIEQESKESQKKKLIQRLIEKEYIAI